MNRSLTLVVNEVWVDSREMGIRMKNQQNIEALLNGTNVGNVDQWAKM